MLTLPAELAAITGAVLTVDRPPQGLYFDVVILTTEQGRFVLKMGRTPALIAELTEESGVLTRLPEGFPAVGRPVAHTVSDGCGYFLFSCVPGENLLSVLLREPDITRHCLVASMGEALRALHGWTPDFPRPHPDRWLRETLAAAREHVQSGAATEPIQRRGWNGPMQPREVLAYLEERAGSIDPQIRFCHGDFFLPNALVREGRVTGVIDWSRGGYRDYRTDLVQTVRSIRWNLKDESMAETFLQAYGYKEPLPSLDWFDALDVLLP